MHVSADVLWDRLFPKATHRHWDPTIAAIEAGRSPDHFFIVHAVRDYHDLDRIPIQVFDVEPGRTFKIRDHSHHDLDDGGSVQVTQFTFQSRDAGTDLTIHEGMWRPQVSIMLNRWLDDVLGDRLEHIAALLEERPDCSVTGRGWMERVSDAV